MRQARPPDGSRALFVAGRERPASTGASTGRHRRKSCASRRQTARRKGRHLASARSIKEMPTPACSPCNASPATHRVPILYAVFRPRIRKISGMPLFPAPISVPGRAGGRCERMQADRAALRTPGYPKPLPATAHKNIFRMQGGEFPRFAFFYYFCAQQKPQSYVIH